MLRPLVVIVDKLVGVRRDLLGDRCEGARLRLGVDHLLRRMEFAAEEIKVLAIALHGKRLQFHAELFGEFLKVFVIAIHELAAELAEHALVEIVVGVHASTPAIARLEENRLKTCRVQSVGCGQSGDPTPDDGDRGAARFFGKGGPLQAGSEDCSAGRRGREPEQSTSRQGGRARPDDTGFEGRTGQGFLEGRE